MVSTNGGHTQPLVTRAHGLERGSAHIRTYPCDVTEEAQLDATIVAICTELDAPKVLIHNAVGGAFGNFEDNF
jgi:NAD(P)-dependent dehydrogenase (short-subunit alcohol dehydrogenase family)